MKDMHKYLNVDIAHYYSSCNWNRKQMDLKQKIPYRDYNSYWATKWGLAQLRQKPHVNLVNL